MPDRPETKARLNEKPHGASRMFVRFRCQCGRDNLVCEHFAEWADLGDGDDLHFTCDCGQFYKKMGRIADAAILDRWYEAETAGGIAQCGR